MSDYNYNITPNSGYEVFDIANWFLNKKGSMPHRKIQKICYYSEAWYLTLFDKKLFYDTYFEAWSGGPVSPELYSKLKTYGWRDITIIEPYNSSIVDNLNKELVNLLNSIWETYGHLTGDALGSLTHIEPPWRKAREGLNNNERGNIKISQNEMKSYYRSIYTGDE